MSTPKDHISDHTPSASELARDEQPIAMRYATGSKPAEITAAEGAIHAAVVALNDKLIQLVIDAAKYTCPTVHSITLYSYTEDHATWFSLDMVRDAQGERLDLDEDGDEREDIHEPIDAIAADLITEFDDRTTGMDTYTITLEDQDQS